MPKFFKAKATMEDLAVLEKELKTLKDHFEDELEKFSLKMAEERKECEILLHKINERELESKANRDQVLGQIKAIQDYSLDDAFAYYEKVANKTSGKEE